MSTVEQWTAYDRAEAYREMCQKRQGFVEVHPTQVGPYDWFVPLHAAHVVDYLENIYFEAR